MRPLFEQPEFTAHPASCHNQSGLLIAVIVTCNRPHHLSSLLNVLARQTRRIDTIVVVDNGRGRTTGETTSTYSRIVHIESVINLGGAGGYALGILYALSLGAELLWVMDDDGYPADLDTLDRLASSLIARDLDAVSPLVVDADDPSRLAYPLRLGHKFASATADVAPLQFVDHFAHLFNGLLIKSCALMRMGTPDLRLFMRGDELDIYYRMLRFGLRFGTDTTIHFFHPSSKTEIVPIIPNIIHVAWPAIDPKRELFFRNRGYLIRTHGLWYVLARDLRCYPWFFLVKRSCNVRDLLHWLGAMFRGAKRQ